MVKDKEEFETWEETINSFLLNRINKKHEELLIKKDKKKPLEKQGIIFQIQDILIKKFENDNRHLVKLQKLKFTSNFKVLTLRDFQYHWIEFSKRYNVYKEIINRKNSGANKQEVLKFQERKFFDLIKFSTINNQDIEHLINQYENELERLKNDYSPENWITDKASRAYKVQFSTNVAKLTHPSIKGATSFFVKYAKEKIIYLSSSSLKNPSLDDSVDNAADTPIVNFLKLSVKNKQIADYIKNKDFYPFNWITNDTNTLNLWVEQFAKSFQLKDMSSHVLSKQVYFPINEKNQEYHILSNVKSSSLAHAIYTKITKYSNVSEMKYTNETAIKYPLRAKIAVTASTKAHSNVSPLNKERDGFLHLLCSQPPIWQSKIKAPIYNKSLFYAIPYHSYIQENIDYLRDFLLRFETLNLSIKDPKKIKHLNRWVENIIDEVFSYIATIQNLEAGWSNADDIKLKKEHQVILDIYRDEEEFQVYFHSNEWQDEVCKDFTEWLNKKLIGKDKKFTPQKEHTKLWKDLIKTELREFADDLAFDIQKKLEEKK